MSTTANVSEPKNRKREHKIVSQEEWIAARVRLLKEEKELTRRSDELARRRQELPWVWIDKGYRFETDEGSASLADLFRGRSQLLVYHFMFGPIAVLAHGHQKWIPHPELHPPPPGSYDGAGRVGSPTERAHH